MDHRQYTVHILTLMMLSDEKLYQKFHLPLSYLKQELFIMQKEYIYGALLL